MSLATYYLDYGRHVARLRRRRAYAPTSNTASQDNHEKINSWVSFALLYVFEYGAPPKRSKKSKTKRREAKQKGLRIASSFMYNEDKLRVGMKNKMGTGRRWESRVCVLDARFEFLLV